MPATPSFIGTWDAEIAEIPLAIADETVAAYFCVPIERVQQVRAKLPKKAMKSVATPTWADMALERQKSVAFKVMAQNGSRDLLRAQLAAGQHHITDPAIYAQRCREVGLV